MGFTIENDRTPAGDRRPGLPMALALVLLGASLLIGSLGFAPAAVASKAVTIYKNDLNTDEKRANVTIYNRKAACAKSSKPTAIRVRVGNETRECFMRVPVVGKNLEITATARLFKSTPKSIRGRTYVGLSVRQSSNGARYQLAVFPAAKKFQLRKVLPNGTIEFFGAGKATNTIKGVGEANRMTLRVFNGVAGNPSSTARLVASVNGKRLAFANDVAGSSLVGTAATLSVGSSGFAKGALGSFTSLVARAPDPFA